MRHLSDENRTALGASSCRWSAFRSRGDSPTMALSQLFIWCTCLTPLGSTAGRPPPSRQRGGCPPFAHQPRPTPRQTARDPPWSPWCAARLSGEQYTKVVGPNSCCMTGACLHHLLVAFQATAGNTSTPASWRRLGHQGRGRVPTSLHGTRSGGSGRSQMSWSLQAMATAARRGWR